ncbi:MAG TPA: hypothetical protein DEF36_14855 [Desulfotomaculum sp.]|nr:hypothetical protein [Desulfotomaculum sp.]
MSIMVVDDSSLIGRIIGSILNKAGYTDLLFAESATEAFKMLGINCPGSPPRMDIDLILLDIIMPNVNGIAACRIIKSTSYYKDIPVIMVTSLTDKEHLKEAFDTGAMDYVIKPVNEVDLLARIRSALKLKQEMDHRKEREKKLLELTKELEVRNIFISQTFGRYVSEELVSRLIENPGELRLGGEKRLLTIMMSDLRGFTAMSEQLPPEVVVTIINNYLSIMVDVVQKYGGTILEFIGDGIMIIFGAPVWVKDHADRAVACAVDMQLAMERVNRWNNEKGFPEVEMGIGLNTGHVIVGNIGSEKRIKYGCVGSHVNLASRIESYTIGGQVLVSGETIKECSSLIEVTKQLEVHPKGINHPVSIYDVCGIGEPYNLRLEVQTHDPRPLKKQIPLVLHLLKDKDVAVGCCEGSMMALSTKYAIIVTRSEIPPLCELKIEILDQEGGVAAGDIYTRVIDNGKDGSGLLVRITAAPTEGRHYLNRIIEEYSA